MTTATPTHYDVLGVARDATPEDIKKAYRQKAGLYHPDRATPGTEETCAAMMAQVNNANDVLSDPTRRQHYDATGADRLPPGVEDEAAGVLVDLFTHALDSSAADLVAWCREQLDSQIESARNDIKAAGRTIQRLGKQRASVRVKKDGATNLMHNIIDAKVAELEKVKVVRQRVIEILNQCHKLLAVYEYAGEKPKPGMDPDTIALGLAGMHRFRGGFSTW